MQRIPELSPEALAAIRCLEDAGYRVVGVLLELDDGDTTAPGCVVGVNASGVAYFMPEAPRTLMHRREPG